MISLKEFLEKVDFEKNQQTTQKHIQKIAKTKYMRGAWCFNGRVLALLLKVRDALEALCWSLYYWARQFILWGGQW